MTSLVAWGQQVKEGAVVKQLDNRQNKTAPPPSNPLIRYPKEAFKHQVQGVVKLQVDYDQNCVITKITVVEGLGYGCDEEAVRILKLREELRIKNGQEPEPCPDKQKIVPVRFEIEE